MTFVPPQELELNVEDVGSAVIVTVRGSVSMGDAETLTQRLEQIGGERVVDFIFDLGEMDFISSAGLGVLVRLARRARHYDGRVKLARPNPFIRHMLEMTRLTEVFPLYATREEAVRA